MNILVIAAHPDDEVLGCGATIARESATHDVRILILGEGITSRHALPGDAGEMHQHRGHDGGRSGWASARLRQRRQRRPRLIDIGR